MAKEADLKWTGSFTWSLGHFHYAASVDVTELVQKTLTKDKKTFAAGDIKTYYNYPAEGLGYNYTDNRWFDNMQSSIYGGWALLIVYDFPEASDSVVAPKAIRIYDGYVELAPLYGDKSTQISFSDFYTPPSGKVDTNLAFLSFGGAKNIKGDAIEIYNKKRGRWESVSSENNDANNQFNSTITKFGKHMNKTKGGKDKIYNNQMDLDVFKITDLIDNKQEQLDFKLTAKVIKNYGASQGDEARVAMVAFSTLLYAPDVCYDETLWIKKDGESKFLKVSTDKNSPTNAKSGDIIRNDVVIRNRANENVEALVITANLDPKSASYIPDTSYIQKYLDYSEANINFPLKESDKNPELVSVNDNTLDFRVGKNANSTSGGFLDAGDKKMALLQFNASLNTKFKENVYYAVYKVPDVPTPQTKTLKKCTSSKQHYIELPKPVLGDYQIVNKKFQKSDDNKNLFTQIAGRKFDVKLAYFLKENNALAPSTFNGDISVDVINDKANCASATNLLKNGARVLKSSDTLNKSLIDIKDIEIENAYQTLYFRIKFKDQESGADKFICNSDPFSVRPKGFNIINLKTNAKFPSDERLIGGKIYENVGVRAFDDNENTTDNYGAIISDIKFTPLLPATCKVSTEFVNNHKFNIKFNKGKGDLIRDTDSVVRDINTSFSYPNVGETTLKVLDDTHTKIDSNQTKPDCIVGSSTDIENSEGKIGCNIEVISDKFRFYPQDIEVKSVDLRNYMNGKMTYMYLGDRFITGLEDGMNATLALSATARLADLNLKATLYNDGCYSANVTYTMDLLDSDENLKGWSMDEVKDNIFYYKIGADDDWGIVIPPTSTRSRAKYNGTFNESDFKLGTATQEINFNVRRDQTDPKRPFILPNSAFTFFNITDNDSTPGAAYTKPADIKTATFYYGMVYAPYYEGLASGFDANIYFGVYCNNSECLKDEYGLSKEKLPAVANWYINKHHKYKAQGSVLSYAKDLNTTQIKDCNSINNGVCKVRLSGKANTLDTIKMSPNKWLIYNSVDPRASTNDFNVKFIGIGSWAGAAMDQGSDKPIEDISSRVRVIGDQNNFENISKRTNRRINW